MNCFLNKPFLIAMVSSLLFHLVLLKSHNVRIFDKDITQRGTERLQVNFTQEKSDYQPLVSNLPREKHSQNIIGKVFIDSKIKHKPLNRIGAVSSKNLSPDIWHTYLPTQLTDRKAIPIGNLDISMFQNIFVSGLPIKLRLFVNDQGLVVKIEKISILEQDRDFTDRLIELLYQTTFLPAKKDGLDISSYQEVEFSFNPAVTSK